MGAYLSEPITTKESEDGGPPGRERLRWGASAMQVGLGRHAVFSTRAEAAEQLGRAVQGWRKGMEDEHIAEVSLKVPSLDAAATGRTTRSLDLLHLPAVFAAAASRLLRPLLLLLSP